MKGVDMEWPKKLLLVLHVREKVKTIIFLLAYALGVKEKEPLK